MRFLALVLAAGLVASPGVGADQAFDKALEAADLLLQQERFDQAIVSYTKLEEGATLPEVRNLLAVRKARVYLARGKIKQAGFMLGQLSREQENFVPGLVEYARLNLYYLAEEAGSLDKAERALQKAKTLAPKNPEVWIEWGALAMARGRFADAIDRYKTVIESMDPRAFPAYHGLARAYIRLDQFNKAREAMRNALEAGAAVAENHWMSGNVELAAQDAGCEERAIGNYLYAIGLDDRIPKYKGWAVVTHFIAHRYGQAAPIEKLLAAQAPGSGFALIAEGMRAEMAGKIGLARERYAAAVDADWNNPWGHWLLANVQNGRGNREIVEAAAFNPFLYGPHVQQSEAAKHLMAVARLAPEFPFREQVTKLTRMAQSADAGKNDPTWQEKLSRFKGYMSKIKGAPPRAQD